MKITSLISKNFRIQIFIDEVYAFSSSQNFIIEEGLFISKEVSEEDVKFLRHKASGSILKAKLIEYTQRGNYSKKELLRKVNKYSQKKYKIEIAQNDFDKKIYEVENLRLYNEQIALSNLVYLYKNSKKGPNYIKSKLLQKGFPKENIEDLLKTQKDFDKGLKAFLEKKLQSLEKKAKDKYDLKQRLIKVALGRGFEYRKVKQFVSEIVC